jgi:3-oxoadipate enol-lactonase
MRLQVELPGRRLTYLDSGAGRPVVLIHAFPLNAGMWLPQLNALPAGWRIIAPDLRGFGGSRAAAGDSGSVAAAERHAREPNETFGSSMADYASDVLDLMDTLGIGEAVIGGLSMGGYVTFEVFRRAPARVRGVILADTRPQADTEEQRQGRRDMQALVDEEGPEAVADKMLPKLLADATRRERPDVEVRVRDLIEATPAGAIKGALQALMTRPDSTPLLAEIRCPALIVVGEQDALTPVADSRTMHERIAGSSLTIIPDAGHLSNLDRPDGFNEAVSRFLATA